MTHFQMRCGRCLPQLVSFSDEWYHRSNLGRSRRDRITECRCQLLLDNDSKVELKGFEPLTSCIANAIRRHSEAPRITFSQVKTHHGTTVDLVNSRLFLCKLCNRAVVGSRRAQTKMAETRTPSCDRHRAFPHAGLRNSGSGESVHPQFLDDSARFQIVVRTR